MLDMNTESRRIELELPEGSLVLQTACGTWLVETLVADRGLCAFSHRPELEQQRLLALARESENVLSLAYTSEGVIVGQVTLAPFRDWEPGVTNAYEIAFEVSGHWRRQGIARSLLNLVSDTLSMEEMIIMGFGLTWHWDIQGLGLTRAGYRAMLVQFLASYGFIDCPTNEGNIRMDPCNVLLARIGSQVPLATTLEFYNDLFKPDFI